LAAAICGVDNKANPTSNAAQNDKMNFEAEVLAVFITHSSVGVVLAGPYRWISKALSTLRHLNRPQR